MAEGSGSGILIGLKSRSVDNRLFGRLPTSGFEMRCREVVASFGLGALAPCGDVVTDTTSRVEMSWAEKSLTVRLAAS